MIFNQLFKSVFSINVIFGLLYVVIISCSPERPSDFKELLKNTDKITLRNSGFEIKRLKENATITNPDEIENLISVFSNGLKKYSDYHGGTNIGYIEISFFNQDDLLYSVSNVYSVYSGAVIRPHGEKNNYSFKNDDFFGMIENTLYEGPTLQDFIK